MHAVAVRGAALCVGHAMRTHGNAWAARGRRRLAEAAAEVRDGRGNEAEVPNSGGAAARPIRERIGAPSAKSE